MIRALFVLNNPIESPGERYRIYQFLPYFEKNGVECIVTTLLRSSDYEVIYEPGHTAKKMVAVLAGFGRRVRALSGLRRVSVAVIYRQPIFLWPGLIESFLARAVVPYIFDFDDAIYLFAANSVNPLASLLRPPGSVRRTIAGSACTVVGNRILADYARQFSKNVVIIPTCIDTDRFRPLRNGGSRTDSKLIIGWIGSHSTAPYLRHLDDAFRELARKYTNFKVRVVGGEYRLPDVPVECKPWSLDTELSDLQEFDVGIMPLANDPWTQAKCGLKILQYMAVGVPVVASPVGVNAEIIQDGENGFLAANARLWVDRLSQLIQDPVLRARLGMAGRRTVEASYSTSAAARRYLDLIRANANPSHARASMDDG